MSNTPVADGRATSCAACPLRQKRALREFSADELAIVQRMKTGELRMKPGASFLRQGERNEHFYTILSGWAFRYKMLPDGRRQILNYALPADLVGLQGSLMVEMEHSVEALTDVTLCAFPRERLWTLYSNSPSLAFDITWLAAREEQLVDEHLLTLGQRTALERTAYVLLHLYTRAEEVGLTRGSDPVHLPITQQHLADTLGLSLVHTNKTLKRLHVAGMIRWKDRLFEVLDRQALAAAAGGDITRIRQRPFI
ncbi:MAG: cAMP-binding protein [Pseudolabrys sp.]|jgi:CRP-like cAMP-binding protein|nr:cAMP-binding protein [Pseudolabrys sp.]